MRIFVFLMHFVPWIASSSANVEKTIFLAPEAIEIPQDPPNLDNLHLKLLTPFQSTLRTQLAASFPQPNSPGTVSWFLLDELQPGQRHEVRICWLATQPTAFTLDTFPLAEVFSTPELITSLASYSESHEESLTRSRKEPASKTSSLLLLRIIAAADYYTSNRTLMQSVPPVNVDIILDPFLLNILPKSLLPTGLYLAVIAVVAWNLSSYIWQLVSAIALLESDKKQQ